MAIQDFSNNKRFFIGLSTDDRTMTFDNGAELYLTDTGETLVYANGAWHKKSTALGFHASGIFTGVANDATISYSFRTPTVASGKLVKLKYRDFQGTASKIRCDFYEAPTNAPAAGADLTIYNHNRLGTPAVSTMQSFKANMTLDLTGATMMETGQFISSRPIEIEYVLKPNTWYIRTFTNFTGASADISFIEYWVEE